jgi:hypothetical protein
MLPLAQRRAHQCCGGQRTAWMTSDIAHHSPVPIPASVAFFPLERGWTLLGPVSWKGRLANSSPASRWNVGGSPTRLGRADRSDEAVGQRPLNRANSSASPGAAMTADAGDVVRTLRPWPPHNVPALSFSRIAAEDNVTLRGMSPQSEHD